MSDYVCSGCLEPRACLVFGVNGAPTVCPYGGGDCGWRETSDYTLLTKKQIPPMSSKQLDAIEKIKSGEYRIV